VADYKERYVRPRQEIADRWSIAATAEGYAELFERLLREKSG
jgi:hypothetical protein